MCGYNRMVLVVVGMNRVAMVVASGCVCWSIDSTGWCDVVWDVVSCGWSGGRGGGVVWVLI